MAGKINLQKLRADLTKHQIGLRDNIPDGEQPEAYGLADRIIQYCEENGHQLPWGTVLTPSHCGDALCKAWLTETAEAYFTANIRSPVELDAEREAKEKAKVEAKEKAKAEAKAKAKEEKAKESPPSEFADIGPDSVWRHPGTMAYQHAAVNLLGQHFIGSARSDSSMQLYKIESWPLRQVFPVEGSPSDVNAMVARTVVKTLAADGVAVSAEKIGVMLNAFTALVPLQDPPQLHGQPDDDAWALHRATVVPDASVPFPNIRQFLDRINDPEAYSAWWWGIYAGVNRGRQMLYLWDRRGEGGKSKFHSAIARKLFGDRVYTSFPPGASGVIDSHMSSHFVGKRLVLIGDCKNGYIFHVGVLKELSGDDKSFVNPKYQQPYSTSFQCRVGVASNVPPFITSQAHNTSRTLFLTLAPLDLSDDERDVGYADKCVAEIPGWLAYAKECYERLCPNHYAVQVNAAVQEATQLRIAQCEIMHAAVFENYFEVDDTSSVSWKEWSGVCKDAKLDQHKADDLLCWMQAVHDVTPHCDTKVKTGWYLDKLRLKTLRERNDGGSFEDMMDGLGGRVYA